MDLEAISNAVAARYAPGTMTAPAGELAVRSSSADPPGGLGALPCVLVFVDELALDPGPGTRTGVVELLVRFYLMQTVDGDLSRESTTLRSWLEVLIDRHKDLVHLGIPTVVAATRTIGAKIGVLPYGGASYAGVECRVQVVTSEPWAATA